ncbi:hypothetical protein [Paractinoplanes globisporus]|uniref:Tetratricopeptide repeat protein n=1 Tax=Paractinoplanes globisporus TaxID=113565 RepID=A0ABW6WJE6_9ACTN|nr:hypothetical protein [Actinoplanes globisporus]
MTNFGSTVDVDSTTPATVTKDRAVRPSLLPKKESQLPTGVVKKPRLDDVDAHGLEERWAASVKRNLTKSLAIANANPDSMIAAARLAEAALLAGARNEAVEAAVKVLTIGQNRTHHVDADIRIEVPAAYLAAQVLIRLDEKSAAEEHLRGYESVPVLAQLYAGVLIDGARHEEALAILHRLDASKLPGVAGLRGYVYAIRGDFHRAITELRLAQRVDPNDSDAAVNLAVAFWGLGSPRKAIQAARRAVRISPGRISAAVTLLSYLAQTRDFEGAGREISKFRGIGIEESWDLLTVESLIAANTGKSKSALALLRRARQVAQTAGSEIDAAALEGRIAVYEFRSGTIDQAETLQKIRSAIRRAPTLPLLVALLADTLEKKSSGYEVEQALGRIDRTIDPSISRAIDCRLAFVKGDFTNACSLALEWSEQEPLNERAARLSALWDGGLNEQWQKSAERTVSLLKKIGPSPSLVNAAAYSLALAGRGREALPILATIAEPDYVLMATAGLVEISIGNLQAGFDLYRRAANQADTQKSAPSLRLLMTLHQAMGLRRLRIEDSSCGLVRASALPPVDLPSDWQDDSELRFLAEIARRHKWRWPVMVD